MDEKSIYEHVKDVNDTDSADVYTTVSECSMGIEVRDFKLICAKMLVRAIDEDFFLLEEALVIMIKDLRDNF